MAPQGQTTAFVTGANGRVGRVLVSKLAGAGHRVIGLARDEAKAAVVREAGGEALTGSLEDGGTLDRGLAEAAVVYHLAGGLRGPGRVTADQVNLEGTRHLLAALERRGGAGLDAVVFTSTCAVYGDRSSLWVEEDIPAHPNTNYGHSKASAERALLDAHGQRGLPVRIVRLAAVYGPGFPFMMVEPMKRGRAWLPGEGRNFVPTIHVDDAAAGIERIADQGDDGGIYNLADPNPVPLAEFYREVHRHSGGRPVRFWSTWIPSYIQHRLARANERVASKLGRYPRFTPDNLHMFTASVRMRVDRMEKELEFEWRWPHARDGIAACF